MMQNANIGEKTATLGHKRFQLLQTNTIICCGNYAVIRLLLSFICKFWCQKSFK